MSNALLLKSIEERLQEIEREKDVLLKTRGFYLQGGAATPPLAAPKAPEKSERLTNERAVLKILAEHPKIWITQETLIAAARTMLGVELKKSSIQPLLSYMKRDKKIIRNNELMASPERVRSEGFSASS